MSFFERKVIFFLNMKFYKKSNKSKVCWHFGCFYKRNCYFEYWIRIRRIELYMVTWFKNIFRDLSVVVVVVIVVVRRRRRRPSSVRPVVRRPSSSSSVVRRRRPSSSSVVARLNITCKTSLKHPSS